MPEICYKPKKFGKKKLAIINLARQFVADYQAQGFDLTIRQLFYKFVSEGLLPNTERTYKNLIVTVSEARMAGLLDWDAIVDRTRKKEGQTHWSSPKDIVDAAVQSYRIDKWGNQPIRIEVWVEKRALIEVVGSAAYPLDVDYFSCNGYTSQSAMWRAARRLREHEDAGQETVVLHLGDHDPSGVDMSRDIQERLWLFGSDASVRRIALTIDQVNALNPPPNPTKATDSRADSYVAMYGHECWELDALEPKYIVDLVTQEILKLRDPALWDKAVDHENHEIGILEEAAKIIERKLEE